VTTQVIRSIAELRKALASVRETMRTIGLVPTMGALHAGHAKLIETAQREADCVVTSIFVNPIQFNRNEDYDRYPRDLSNDVEFCTVRGVDLIFAPPADEMYPEPQRAFVDVEALSDHLCGEFRPGHFRGVATVVLKLLNIVQPSRAYFGEKDAQQLAVIRRMVKDLNIPVAIVEVPTVRETDGFALSSRNQQLNAEERRIAPALNQALRRAEKLISAGVRGAEEIKSSALAILQRYPEIRVEYLEIVDPESMQPVEAIAGPVRVMMAAWIGKTRLIDNVLCRQPVQAANS
jgi:pantoate--beta-alanine ligase